MKIVGSRGTRFLKIFHLCCIAVWFGSIMSWVPLVFGLDSTDYEAARSTYLNMRSIALNVIGWGGMGSLFSGLLLVTLTKWSLFRHRWVAVKFAALVILVIFGMFFMEEWMLANAELLQHGSDAVLEHLAFRTRHNYIKIGLAAEGLVFAAIIGISVIRPRLRRR